VWTCTSAWQQLCIRYGNVALIFGLGCFCFNSVWHLKVEDSRDLEGLGKGHVSEVASALQLVPALAVFFLLEVNIWSNVSVGLLTLKAESQCGHSLDRATASHLVNTSALPVLRFSRLLWSLFSLFCS
jgi:hypothetical protein